MPALSYNAGRAKNKQTQQSPDGKQSAPNKDKLQGRQIESRAADYPGATDYPAGLPGLRLEKQEKERGGYSRFVS
uniref:SFRICE_020316 n=1 Tax=Spodoptera frugiperda TaxID=7108 RepID=A0A2H1W1T7_SPOFR